MALGGVALAVATVALANINGSPFGPWSRLNEWFFPSAVAALLAIIGVVLVVRGFVSGGTRPERWRLRRLLVIAGAVVAAWLPAQVWGSQVMLQIRPADLVMLMVLLLAVAVALACASRVRAFAMVSLGLLLGAAGTDLETGVPRFTLGVPDLLDGIGAAIPELGLLIVADGVLCLASPNRFVESYARQVMDWSAPQVPAIAGVGLRIVAAFAIAAACYFAYILNASTWDVGMLVVFAAFGVACRVFGWNRLLLILALLWETPLEENIKRAMLISRGDPYTFVQSAFGGSFLLLTCIVLVVSAVASARRAVDR
jgi:TctA family transporter